SQRRRAGCRPPPVGRRTAPALSPDACACILSDSGAADMNPLLFLTQAQRLAAATAEEDWRTATSRAYYAAFHIASAFMANLGFTVPNAERAHAYLWLRLQKRWCCDRTACRHPFE